MDRKQKPKLAVWKFSSCDGCQLSLLDCEDELLAVAGEVEIANFPEASRAVVRQPLLATETADKFDILITTAGGGPTGQAGAAKLGIARALLEFNAELRAKLKELGMLTRDARQHERKKYGQKGARKRFQFSKR